jgi:hypothetical protein
VRLGTAGSSAASSVTAVVSGKADSGIVVELAGEDERSHPTNPSVSSADATHMAFFMTRSWFA